MSLMGKRKEPHKRPTAEQLDERVKLPDDPAKVIEAILNVDPDAPEVDKTKANDCP